MVILNTKLNTKIDSVHCFHLCSVPVPLHTTLVLRCFLLLKMATILTASSSSTSAVEDAVRAIRAAAFDVDARIAVVTLMKIIKNVLVSEIGETKYRNVRLDNANFQARVGRVKGGLALLEAVHFETSSDGNFLVLSPINEATADLLSAMKRLDAEGIVLDLGDQERPRVPSLDEIKCGAGRPSSSSARAPSSRTAREKVDAAVKQIRASAFDIDAKVTVLTLMKMTRNVLVTPSFDEKKRTVRVNNQAFHAKVGRVRGGLDFLLAIGFAPTDGNQRFVLSPEREDKEALYEAMTRLNAEAGALEIPPQDRPTLPTKDEVTRASSATREVTKAVSSFDPYKTKIKRVTPQPRPGSKGGNNSGKSETEIKLERLQKRLKDLLAKQKVPATDADRGILVFRPGHGPSRGSLSKLARDMSSDNEKVGGGQRNGGAAGGLTDTQKVMQTMKRRREAQERSELFRTKAMREVDELENMKVYSSVILRLQFSDGWIIQANFSPGETVAEVVAFLERFALVDESGKVHLYVTPPKQVLDEALTLARSGLQPAALVYVGSNASGFNGANSLLPRVQKMGEKTAGGEAVAGTAMPTSSSVHVPGRAGHSGKGAVESKSGEGGGRARAGKKPKWLKT